MIVYLEFANRYAVDADGAAFAPLFTFFLVTEFNRLFVPINWLQALDQLQYIGMFIVVQDGTVKCRMKISMQHCLNIGLDVALDFFCVYLCVELKEFTKLLFTGLSNDLGAHFALFFCGFCAQFNGFIV